MITLYIHISGLETTVVEVEELPGPADTSILCRNPRKRDGKDVDYIYPGITTLILPMSNITFIEVLTDDEEEDIETFIRE